MHNSVPLFPDNRLMILMSLQIKDLFATGGKPIADFVELVTIEGFTSGDMIKSDNDDH